jgi:hypothetical protein
MAQKGNRRVSFTFRPAKRENTPLIIGLAGPTKSGKTYSAHRLSRGLVSKPDPRIIMLNAEGARGHQYADEFNYIACDIDAPFGPDRYADAVIDIKKEKPDAVIIDSCSHMHDGPGGLLEWHESELDRMAGQDYKKRERCTWAAWIKPKAAENAFIYAMLSLDCPVTLCFRAKEKLKLVPGKEPIDLGWQPIAGDRITFETIFTLVLPPHSKGVPDLSASEMRKPFDSMVPVGKPIDEDLGRKLAEWSVGRPALSEDEVKDLLLGMEAATSMDALKKLGERAKLAPLSQQDHLRGVYAAMQKKLKPITPSSAAST